MKPSLETKLQTIVERYDELKMLLSDPNVTNDLNRYRELSKEFAQLEPHVQSYLQYRDYLQQLDDAKLLAEENDLELQQLAKQEIKSVEENIITIEDKLL